MSIVPVERPRAAARVAGMLLAVVALGALTLVGLAPATAVGAAPAAPTHPVRLVGYAGIRVVHVTQVDPRLLDVTMTTAALSGPVHVDVLVPSDYASQPQQRFPSIYLLHGCNAGNNPNGPFNGLDYLGWTEFGQAEQTTANAQVIVVMPEGGSAAASTNWYNNGAGGPPQWETFQVSQLVPWIDHNFRTIPTRGERAIAGLSMGGFGSLSYAARHPDLFGQAAAFSGADDLTDPPNVAEPISTVIVGACALSEGGQFSSTFGDHTTEELNWRAHDPPQLAVNLRHTKLYLYTGNGAPGPLDPPGTKGVDGIEALAHEATIGFHTVLQSMGIPSYFDDYGPGTHTFPYWARDFREVLPKFMAQFARNAGDPSRFTYLTDAATYSVYGWTVRLHRRAAEFSTLENADAHGFTVTGSGQAVVVTGPDYRPLSDHHVVIVDGRGRRSLTVHADLKGRLHVDLVLGPSNPFQEFTAAALRAGTNVFAAKVTVA